MLSLALFLLILQQSHRLAEGLKCWECLEDKCSISEHWHAALATERDCPTNFVCQKTIFHFLYNKDARDATTYKVRSTVMRGCAFKCLQVNERTNCTIFSYKVQHMNEDMNGCVERYCCASSLCNSGRASVANRIFVLLISCCVLVSKILNFVENTNGGLT